MLPTQRTALVAISRLVHDLDPVGPPAPQRVDHGLDVLLVHDEVVGTQTAGTGVARAARRRVVEGDAARLDR